MGYRTRSVLGHGLSQEPNSHCSGGSVRPLHCEGCTCSSCVSRAKLAGTARSGWAGRLALCAGLALSLAAGSSQAQVKDLTVFQRYLKSGGALVPEAGFTVRYTLAAPSPVTLVLRKHAAPSGQNPGTLFPGSVVKTVKLPRQAAGAKTYAWSGKLDSGEPVTATVTQPDGSTKDLPVGVFTVEAQAGTTPIQSLTFSRATGPETPKYLLVPQAPGNVFGIGQNASIGLSVSNLAATTKRLPVNYDCAVPQGALLKAGKATLTLGPLQRVSMALPLGAPSIPGLLRISATVTDGGPISLVTSGGTVPQHLSPATPETPFGVVGLREPQACAALGARWWLGSWPWGVDPARTGRAALPLDAPSGFLAEADRNGVSVGSSLAPQEAGGFSAYLSFIQQAMRSYIRKLGVWQLPMEDGTSDYAQQLRAFYAASKSIHKDAATMMDAGSSLEVAKQLADDGAAGYTDILAVRGVTDSSPEALSQLVALRDTRYPGKEIWNTAQGGTVAGVASGDANALVKSAVRQVAAGVDRVFWQGQPALVKPDGTPTSAFFGFSTLTYFLGGSEYVGALNAPEGAEAYVFQKRGKVTVVAWSNQGVKTMDLPTEPGVTLLARDPGYVKAGFGRISGSKVTLTGTPLFLEGIRRSVWTSALQNETEVRLATAREAAQAAGVEMPAVDAGSVNEEAIASLFEAGTARYRELKKDRGPVVNYLFQVNRLADLVALALGMSQQTTLVTSDKAMDTANHATADLRVRVTLREGVTGYLREIRTLLRQAERPKTLALVARKQGDLALAQARAEQSTQFCKALAEVVSEDTVWVPSRELTASR